MKKPGTLSLEDQISRKCIHFNGVMNDLCNAGVKYSDVRIDKPYKFPCLSQGGECPKASFRTEDEVKQKVAEIEGSGIKVLVAIGSIKDHVAKTNDRSGSIPCQCGGKLHFTVAAVNGHIWAKCITCGMAFNE